MADSRVVIKINVDKSKKPGDEAKIVTVWHTERIAAAAFGLVLLIAAMIWLFSGDDAEPTTEQPVISALPLPETTSVEPAAQAPAPVQTKTTATLERPAAIILDRHVVRASLNTSFKADEPDGKPQLPIRLQPGQTLELHYFTELKNLQGKTLQHIWLRNGQLVSKKHLPIKDKLFKISSSRVLSSKDQGVWQVKLINGKDKLLSEANFLVSE